MNEDRNMTQFPSLASQVETANIPLPTPTLVLCGDRSVRARIDRNVPVAEIINQLCASPQLGIAESPSLFALRDAATDELVTSEMISKTYYQGGGTLKLVHAPSLEAASTINKLQNLHDKASVKAAVFQLRTYIREDAFVTEFLNRQGMTALANVIQTSSGNTLAYALSAMQSLLDLELGWDDLDHPFVQRIADIVTTQALVNIVRPALTILRRLFLTDHPKFGFDDLWPILSPPHSSTDSASSPSSSLPILQLQSPRTSSSHTSNVPGEFFKTLSRRIARESDKYLISSALSLLVAILKNISTRYFYEAWQVFERHSFRKAVIMLIENHTEDVTPQILQFQQAYAILWYSQSQTPVDLSPKSLHTNLLQEIYRFAGLAPQLRSIAENISPNTISVDHQDFTKLGLSQSTLSENGPDFKQTQVFGLLSLCSIASTRQEGFARMVMDQVNRPAARKCPIALASLQVSRILSDHFDLSGSSASTSFQPFLLDLYRVHYVVLEFFIRMFYESGASVDDFSRVADLTRSQVRTSLIYAPSSNLYSAPSPSSELENDNSDVRKEKSFFDLIREFEEAKYEQVRDRQMKELEIEDDLMSKLPVRNLRDRLYRESFAFVRSQRINCLHLGSWFTVLSTHVITGTTTSTATQQKSSRSFPTAKYRFYRLAPNKRHLHYWEGNEKKIIRPGLDDLPDRIDLSQITEVTNGVNSRIIRSQTSLSSPNPLSASLSVSSLRSPSLGPPQASQAHPSNNPLAITLLSHEAVISEVIAPTPSVLSEWLDGLNLLLPEGYISTKESADYIQTLTDIGVKIKLLDLSGERLDIPTALPMPIVPPASVPFVYAE